MRTRKPDHLKTFDYIGLHRYSLTFCTDRRKPAFRNHTALNLVLSQILRSATENRFAIVAYCFMPDHLHLLIEGQTNDSDAKRFITRAKQYSGFYYAKTYHQALWQRYGFEHVLRDDQITRVVARYILENPVRAGLAECVADYPFVGSHVYEVKDLLDNRMDGSG
jgi:putative transposase